MKAITYHRYGPPDVIGVEDVPTPTPGDGESRRACPRHRGDPERRRCAQG